MSQQVAKLLTFPADLIPFINWDSIGAMRLQLACDIDVRRTPESTLTIRLFWPAD
jgi:hypothetical protein